MNFWSAVRWTCYDGTIFDEFRFSMNFWSAIRWTCWWNYFRRIFLKCYSMNLLMEKSVKFFWYKKIGVLLNVYQWSEKIKVELLLIWYDVRKNNHIGCSERSLQTFVVVVDEDSRSGSNPQRLCLERTHHPSWVRSGTSPSSVRCDKKSSNREREKIQKNKKSNSGNGPPLSSVATSNRGHHPRIHPRIHQGSNLLNDRTCCWNN